jgi:hypothetical protein
MAIEEYKKIDLIEIVENGTFQIRESNKILKDGIEIAKTYHRQSFAPGSDVSKMPKNIQAIANIVWTSDIITEYKKLEVQP